MLMATREWMTANPQNWKTQALCNLRGMFGAAMRTNANGTVEGVKAAPFFTRTDSS